MENIKYPIFKDLEIEKLFMDDCNPRLPVSIHGKDERFIIDHLLLQESTLELMQAIGENDFFPGEQLLVVKLENDTYKVIEGNRRLASVKLLNDCTLTSVKKSLVQKVYDEAKFRPQKIPCLIFEDEITIKKYLGFRHITGIKSWGLSEKARYLNDLRREYFKDKSFGTTCRELAKMIGSRSEYIKRVLVAFDIFLYIEDEGYFDIKDLNDTTFYVGYYSDSLSRSNISKFIGIDMSAENPTTNMNKENIKLLTNWFYHKFELNGKVQTRLKGKSSDLNDLNSILGNEKSYDAFVFNNFTLKKALDLADDIEMLFQNSIRNSLFELEQADQNTHRLESFYFGLEEDLIQIRKLTSKIKESKDQFEKKDFDKDEF